MADGGSRRKLAVHGPVVELESTVPGLKLPLRRRFRSSPSPTAPTTFFPPPESSTPTNRTVSPWPGLLLLRTPCLPHPRCNRHLRRRRTILDRR